MAQLEGYKTYEQQEQERIAQDHLLHQYGYDLDNMSQWERNNTGKHIRKIKRDKCG